MQVYGNVDDELIAAAKHFACELIKDGRVRRKLNVEIIEDPTMMSFAGLTTSDDERTKKPSYFTIRINPVAGDHKLQCLAHEMVHVKQFATGQLEDRMNGTIIWEGEKFTGIVSYEGEIDSAPPWEQEAYQKEVDLFEDFLALEVLG